MRCCEDSQLEWGLREGQWGGEDLRALNQEGGHSIHLRSPAAVWEAETQVLSTHTLTQAAGCCHGDVPPAPVAVVTARKGVLILGHERKEGGGVHGSSPWPCPQT